MVQVVDTRYEPRDRLLETLREFGRDRLARDGAADNVLAAAISSGSPISPSEGATG